MKNKHFAGFIALGCGLVAIGIATSQKHTGFISFIAAGIVFIIIGIVKMKEAKSSDSQ